jgi:subtilisin family serine protease
MVICFAAGNGGDDHSVGSPGTGKNLISVAASESFKKGGDDGCGVEDIDADNAMDIAFFSSGGAVDDGRMKPDLSAAGTHIQGAASQHPDFNGSGVCGEEDSPYFPKAQTLYTWSSGTSHSTPAVAGAAALARQFFLNRGEQPSAALIKAILLNTTTYLTGALASGDLPQKRQGWGLLDLGRAFDSTPKVFINQSQVFTDSGQGVSVHRGGQRFYCALQSDPGLDRRARLLGIRALGKRSGPRGHDQWPGISRQQFQGPGVATGRRTGHQE